MKKHTKAVLLSGLVFPGMGHLYLNRFIVGVVLLGVSLTSVYFVMSSVLAKALIISDKIQSGDVPFDVMAITNMVSKQTTGADEQVLNAAVYTLIICWVIGMVDSFRVGRRDLEANKHNRP